MTPGAARGSHRLQLVEFKANARRFLPPDHPLLLVLSRVPDVMDAVEFEHRVIDWITLLEEA